MTAWRFTTNGKIIRRVTVDSSGIVTLNEPLSIWLGIQWVKTGRHVSGLDRGGPRRERTDLIRYRNGVLAPMGGPLRAGDRLDLEGVVYEVLEDSRDVHLGRRSIALEVPVQAITVLYPLEGALAEQGGAPVEASVRFSVYSADEAHQTTGTYEDYAAEADISLHDKAKVNRNFVTDGKIYKITAAENDLTGKYVRMTVRKSGVSA